MMVRRWWLAGFRSLGSFLCLELLIKVLFPLPLLIIYIILPLGL